MPQTRGLRILIATVSVPFVRGGAEVHAEGLCQALRDAGHQAEIVAIPFKWYPPERVLDHMLACRLLDLSEAVGVTVDRMIALKFPAYLMPHPRKVIWLLHQHRQAYNLWRHPLNDLDKSPNGEEVRAAIERADRELIPQALHVYANSRTVAGRLQQFCGVDSEPLYHPPPGAGHFYACPAEDYLYFPSRINLMKRQDLVLEALAHTRLPVKVYFSGAPEDVAFERKCTAIAEKNGCAGRVEWLGPVPEEKKRELYARARGVLFPPVDEDYGYITLEGMLAHKPVITCTDSGGPLEFVMDRKTGLVAEPTAESLAAAMDELWQDRERARRWGEAGRQRYDDLRIDWRHVVEKLLA